MKGYHVLEQLQLDGLHFSCSFWPAMPKCKNNLERYFVSRHCFRSYGWQSFLSQYCMGMAEFSSMADYKKGTKLP